MSVVQISLNENWAETRETGHLEECESLLVRCAVPASEEVSLLGTVPVDAAGHVSLASERFRLKNDSSTMVPVRNSRFTQGIPDHCAGRAGSESERESTIYTVSPKDSRHYFALLRPRAYLLPLQRAARRSPL